MGRRDRSPIGQNVERAARRISQREHVSMAKARASVHRSVALRAYWTRARSYADKHKTDVRTARSSAGFKRNEATIKRSGVTEGMTERQQRGQAEKLMRALVRQGLVVGKGKTWRDYVRKRGRR